MGVGAERGGGVREVKRGKGTRKGVEVGQMWKYHKEGKVMCP